MIDYLVQFEKIEPIIEKSKVLWVLINRNLISDLKYIERINPLFGDTKFPILSLTDNIFTELEENNEFSPNGPRYLMETISEFNSLPTMGWKKAAEIINLFDAEQVIFAGKKLVIKDNKYQGQLGIAYDELSQLIKADSYIDSKYSIIETSDNALPNSF
ncbi:hypothetical protein, partial [Candidatus Venteria ishoeyi]|uniref:hypothetical protein n=1 Tax=Candidatus Venteria ishoeyi TaxID=1899563 RepID=UPI0011B02533